MHDHSSSELLLAEKATRPFRGSQAAWKVSLAYVTFAVLWLLTPGLGEMDTSAWSLWAFLGISFLLLFVLVQLFVSKASLIQRALEDSEQRYRSFMGLSTDGIWRLELLRPMAATLDEDGQIAWLRDHAVFAEANRTFLSMTGFSSRDEVLGKRLVDLFPPEELPNRGSFRNFVESGFLVVNAETSRERPDGQRRHYLSSTMGVVEDGHLTRIWGNSTDVTARKRAQEEAEQQRQELIAADKLISLGTLVSGVAHEVNNPNQYILLNAKLLRDAWDDTLPVLDDHASRTPGFRLANVAYEEMRLEIGKIIDEIRKGSDRIGFIVSELRNFSRHQDPREFEAMDLNQAVESALTLLKSPIRKATDRFSTHLQEGLPRIRGNVRRLEQVVINLILNACQALEGRDESIRVRTGHDPRSAQVFLSVRDAGRGISEQDLAHVRDPFFTTRRPEGGTGLGLAVASRIIEEHEGHLEIESEPGEGTVVKALFPDLELERES